MRRAGRGPSLSHGEGVRPSPAHGEGGSRRRWRSQFCERASQGRPAIAWGGQEGAPHVSVARGTVVVAGVGLFTPCGPRYHSGAIVVV